MDGTSSGASPAGTKAVGREGEVRDAGRPDAAYVDEHGALPVPWAAFIGAQACAVLLAGERPFRSRNLLDEIARSQSEPPPPLDDTPAELADVVGTLQSKDPGERPGDALAVYDRLRPWKRDPAPIPGWTTRDLSGDPGHLYTVALAHLVSGG